jgi:hypothetical protein
MTQQHFKRSWNSLMKWRTECFQRFGPIHDLPVRSVEDQMTGLLFPHTRVLDVGAGAHKPFRKFFAEKTDTYFSLDTDPAGDFDFHSFREIPADQKFDLVLANQVLEHMLIDDAVDTVDAVFAHLEVGGHFVATVPNAAHPVRQRDPTHLTPWPANDLYSLLRSAGFEVVSMARFNKFPLTTDPLKRWVVETVCQEFRVDWCDSVMATGRKIP